MKAHWAYLKVVLRHKWYVFLGCRKMGVPFWLAILHDWSKFLPVEWSAYIHQFYHPDGSKRSVRDTSGAYDPVKQGEAFNFAWLHHQRVNRHHWAAWCSIGDNGTLLPLPTPRMYLREMVADWIGAGLAYSGKADPIGWYAKNKDKMVLHPDSITWLEISLMGYDRQEWLRVFGY